MDLDKTDSVEIKQVVKLQKYHPTLTHAWFYLGRERKWIWVDKDLTPSHSQMHLCQLVARNEKMKVKDLSELNIKRTFDIFSFKSFVIHK